MLRPRVIPSLLVADGRLVKTRQFADPKYVGDPINAVRIFNEKEVDELCVFDISATSSGRGPDFKLISDMATQCRMPLAYGGGVTTAEEARRIIDLGVEKVAVSTAALLRPEIVPEMAREVGAQSVVVVLDVLRSSTGAYHIQSRANLALATDDVRTIASEFSKSGAGEIIINSIDRDGMLNGYDLELARQVQEVVDVPITLLGGAGSLDDIRSLIGALGVVGAAAGSLFVFRGRLRAVLINYPRREDLDQLALAALV